MVIGEAMASGTPVIASDTGGISAMIGGPGAGRIMPQFTDPELWASTIREITRDPESYRMMSDAAFDRATTTLSWTTWAAKLEQVILECIGVGEQQSAA
jgi:glycosyltransferase involved in cell wall biosynthesis